MTDSLETLAHAISDVGFWRWWVAELPNVFQIEFGGVQLWSPPTAEGKPPCGIVALRFTEPIAVAFLAFSKELPQNWIQQFHEDKLEPFSVSHKLFTFNSEILIADLLQQATNVTQFHGSVMDTEQVRRAKFTLSFAAGSVGLIVASNTMELYTSHGIVQIDEVETLNRKWWEYWKEYWRLRETDTPLPKNYACEVTIPAKGTLD